MRAVRGDGVGVEVGSSVLRAIRLHHDVPGRVAAAAELPFPVHDDNAALDALVRLRAELGEPSDTTRLATFPTTAMLQRTEITGRSGPDLNQIRATLDRRHGINSTVVVDDGPRRWLVLIRWDAVAVRRLEDLAERAGFVDVTVEPSPLALARVLPRSTTYVRRLVAQADAHHIVVSHGVPVAATGTVAAGRPHPDIDASDVAVPSAWFDDFVGDVALAELLDRVSGSAHAFDALARPDAELPQPPAESRPVGAIGFVDAEVTPARQSRLLTLDVAGEAYPAFPPHDIRSPLRQGVALGAAAGAAGLAGTLRPVDIVLTTVGDGEGFDRPWAIERMSLLPDIEPAKRAGTVRRVRSRLRPRSSRTG